MGDSAAVSGDNTEKGWSGADMWDGTQFLTSEQVPIVIQPSAEGASRMSAAENVGFVQSCLA